MPGSIQGRVVGASGEPVADATVTVAGGPGPAPDIAPLTTGDGRFVLDNLPEGSWRLTVTGPDGEAGEATVSVSSGAVAKVTIPLRGR